MWVEIALLLGGFMKFLKKIENNIYLRNIIIAVAIYLVVVGYLFIVMDSSLGSTQHDFINQHTLFIDYLRNNFWISGDFFPQWNMNYGMGQSFVTMYYHGLYNPFLLFIYILPDVNPLFIFEFIFLIIVGLNSFAMTKLLKVNNIDEKLNTLVAVASSFSGVYLYHFGMHPMFIYYMPILALSLVALHSLAFQKKLSYYMIAVGLIFYTNFTFAPIISVIQFFYFTGLLIENKQFKIRAYVDFFIAYLTGVLIGMFMLIPIGLFSVLSGIRGEQLPLNFDTFYSLKNIIVQLTTENYSAGIFVVGLVAILGSLFFVRRKKYYIVLIPILILLIFPFANFTFNLFQYLHNKVYLMFVPLYWLMFAEVCKKLSNKKMAGLLFVSAILYLYGNSQFTDFKAIFLVFTGVFLISLVIKSGNKYEFSVLLAILTFGFISYHIQYMPNSSMASFVNIKEDEGRFTPYRETNPRKNIIDSIYNFSPIIYTSLENGNYVDAVRYEYESATSELIRISHDYTVENAYFENFFGIENEITSNINPIVYGVLNSDTTAISSYQGLSNLAKLYAVNQTVFTEGSNNTLYQNQFDIDQIYSSNEPIKISTDHDYSFDLPKQYQDGILTITFDAQLIEDNSQLQAIKINDQYNGVRYADYYGVNDNSKVTFIINTEDVETLDVKVDYISGDPIIYSNFKVAYQSSEDFETKKLDVIEPTDFEVDLNNSFTFKLDLEEDGMLATTIPFDIGYSVYVDGTSVPTQKVNSLYLGAKVPAGEHRVTITFNITGFRLGAVLTASGLLILFVTVIIEVRASRKSKPVISEVTANE